MIPVQDVIPSRSTPLVTVGLLIVASLALIIALWMGCANRLAMIYAPIHMLFLWIFGDNVEGRIGPVRFAALFLLAGAAGVAAHTLMTPQLPQATLLASGGVAGVLGAYFVLYPRSRVLTFFPLPFTLLEIPAVFYLGIFFVLHLPAGGAMLTQLVAGFAIGGLVCVALRKPVVW